MILTPGVVFCAERGHLGQNGRIPRLVSISMRRPIPARQPPTPQVAGHVQPDSESRAATDFAGATVRNASWHSISTASQSTSPSSRTPIHPRDPT